MDRRANGEALECLLLGRVVPQSDVSANERTPRYNPIYPSFRDLPMAWLWQAACPDTSSELRAGQAALSVPPSFFRTPNGALRVWGKTG